MIVGTAGHIDHGKTTLVRALTGVDTDRLPQEKARGISIELGYAFLDAPHSAERIGFIDVPGHERLVHTMLAGATGIDFALLLVAADDGVMPQTREHLAVLALLGVAHGAVAITKIDRADAARVAAVRAEIADLIGGTPLADVPVLAVSSQTGDGLATLRELLFDAARAGTPAPHPAGSDAGSLLDALARAPERAGVRTPADAAFRLAIDRAFTLDGVGTVATGTAHAGRVRIGDELSLAPSAGGATFRVRSLHAQNRPATEAVAGQRCAIGLVGLDKDAVTRGQWLVAPGVALATDRFDVDLTLWHGEARGLRSGTPVHVHVGAVDAMGTVAVLRTANDTASPLDVLPPGKRGWVQIVLRQPIGVWRGDRVVLRDTSAVRTLGGGSVLDPFAPARYRRTTTRFAELAAWALPDRASRLAALISATVEGVSLRRCARAEGIADNQLPPLPDGTLHAPDAGDGGWALGAAQQTVLADETVRTLQGFHAREPDAVGPDAARLRRRVAPRLAEPLWRALLAGLRQENKIALRGAFIHLPEHAMRLSSADERIAQKIAPLLATSGFEGSWARDLARSTGDSEALMRTTLARLAQRGELHQVVKDLCYAPGTMVRLANVARTLAAAEQGAVGAARFRDTTGLGRKRAIQILEYFDRIGLLRRVGEVHRLRSDTDLFSEGGS